MQIYVMIQMESNKKTHMSSVVYCVWPRNDGPVYVTVTLFIPNKTVHLSLGSDTRNLYFIKELLRTYSSNNMILITLWFCFVIKSNNSHCIKVYTLLNLIYLKFNARYTH